MYNLENLFDRLNISGEFESPRMFNGVLNDYFNNEDNIESFKQYFYNNDNVKILLKKELIKMLLENKYRIHLVDLFQNNNLALIFDELLLDGEIYVKNNVCYLKQEKFISNMSSILNDNQTFILTKRLSGCSLSEISEMLGISRERVRMIEWKANSFYLDRFYTKRSCL